MALISVNFPAPWWTPLSYSYESALAGGLRVVAPLGRGCRVAVTSDASAPFDEAKAKPLTAVIDERPVLPAELRMLAKWFGDTWFIGEGFALKSILPAKFFTTEKLEAAPAQPRGKFEAEDLYDADCSRRRARYTELLAEADGGALALFPEVEEASAYWKSLSPGLRAEGALWPQGSAAQWKLWKAVLAGEIRFVVGSPGAAFLPFPSLSAVIMDEENQGSWRTQSHPVYHMRSLLGMRATLAGARFVLGGSMPSSKGFLRAEPKCAESRNEDRLVFVSLRDSLAAEFTALSDTLPISEPLMRDTAEARRSGRWAFWILDRKGYAGELFCDECGDVVRCRRCGSPMRWEERTSSPNKNRRPQASLRRSEGGHSGEPNGDRQSGEANQPFLRCISCGETAELPEKCPNCGGRLLSGRRPGIEALYERADESLRRLYKEVVLLQNGEDKIPKAEELLAKYTNGALLIGTRRLLSLCGTLRPALVGWIDADAEARAQEYDAKARAFSLIWESMQRGEGASERRVVIQSRRPGKGWQEGLRRGWEHFWKRELRERREWELPPYVPMLKIKMPYGAQCLCDSLEEEGFECWLSEESANELWVRTKRFSELKARLDKYFSIARAGKGFPSVLLYLE